MAPALPAAGREEAGARRGWRREGAARKAQGLSTGEGGSTVAGAV